jgi:hypothetical protein
MPKLKYDQYPFDSRSQIRLLQFDNSAFGSWQWSFTPPITITVGAKAEAACRFIATSYEWGSPDDIAPFSIGGEETTLRCNLIHFLNTLSEVQHPDIKTPVYWIDSICINQDDKEEKANQIGLLRDIYSSASCVLSWLGPMGNGSNVAMKYLSGVNIEAGDSVHALLNRRYWTRLWMVQEVVLGKRWYIACGTDVIDGDDLARRFKSSNSHVTRRVFQWTKSRAYKLIRERQRFRKSGPRALVDLMLRFYELDAEFKVDKIRALLGLSKPGTTGNIHGFLTRFVGATGDFDLVKVITHNIYREICWLTGLGRSRDVLVFVASMLHRRTDKKSLKLSAEKLRCFRMSMHKPSTIQYTSHAHSVASDVVWKSMDLSRFSVTSPGSHCTSMPATTAHEPSPIPYRSIHRKSTRGRHKTPATIPYFNPASTLPRREPFSIKREEEDRTTSVASDRASSMILHQSQSSGISTPEVMFRAAASETPCQVHPPNLQDYEDVGTPLERSRPVVMKNEVLEELEGHSVLEQSHCGRGKRKAGEMEEDESETGYKRRNIEENETDTDIADFLF